MGRRIVVTSGKGGVGKTTVTASVGSVLAEMGFKVILVDADIGLNNLDVVMGIENKVVYDILDVITGKCRIRQALVQDISMPSLYVLPSSKLTDNPAITAQNFRNLILSLAALNDFIFIDCPAGIDNGFHRAVSAAEEALVVTTPSISAIRDADKVVNLLSGYDLNATGLVVNRMRGDLVQKGEMMTPADISRLLRLPAVGVIPEDDNITLYSQIGRVPLDTHSGKAFKMLANTVSSGQMNVFDICERRSRFKFFKRTGY